ncbi:hypothetical protein Bca101_026639 [Brassica carinata]
MDPKLSSVLSSRLTAVISGTPVASSFGLHVCFEDGGLGSRRWAVGGGGGEWVAGCDLGQSRLLLRTGDAVQIRWFSLPSCALSLSFQVLFFSGALLSRLVVL